VDVVPPPAMSRVPSPAISLTIWPGAPAAVVVVHVTPSVEVRKVDVTTLPTTVTSLRRKRPLTKRTGLLAALVDWGRTSVSRQAVPSGEVKTRRLAAVAVLTTKVPLPKATPLRGPRVRPVSARVKGSGAAAAGARRAARRAMRRGGLMGWWAGGGAGRIRRGRGWRRRGRRRTRAGRRGRCGWRGRGQRASHGAWRRRCRPRRTWGHRCRHRRSRAFQRG
jgi:hypothetical protein